MDYMKTVSLGIPALDEALMNGVPQGFTVLVCGPPGAGMELFAKQFAAAGIGKEDVVYFSTTERTEDVISAMKLRNWKTDMRIVNIGTEYYEHVLARELEISKYRQEGISVDDLALFREVTDEMMEINFLTMLTYEISKVKPPFRIILDSLDFFLEHYEHHSVLSVLRTLKSHVQHYEGIALVTMLNNVYDTRTQSGVEAIVDCIIELEIQRTEHVFKKSLLIRKVSNYPEKTGILSYTIEDEGIVPQRE